jgi:hypothetical protein
VADSARSRSSAANGARQVKVNTGRKPLFQTAAKVAGDRLRKETDDKAAAIVREADRRADSPAAAARQRANKIAA